MRERTYTLDVAGRTFEYNYAEWALPFLALVGRLVMGFFFIWSGFDKLITDFSASGFLVNASKGPLEDIFVDMGTSSAAVDVIDPLVVYGQILIGFSLILGVFTRVGCFFGALQMVMFYLPVLWPEHNPIIDEHVIYAGIFALLGALGAGRVLGGDYFLERTQPVVRMPWLKYLMG